MPPRVRRVVLWLTAGAVLARLWVLGNERGWGVVGPVAVRVSGTALVAWLVHMIIHELAHWLLATRMNFEVHAVRFGPLRFQLVAERAWEPGGPGTRRGLRWGGFDLGGGVSSFPRGTERLGSRLRAIAVAGPAATALLTLVSFAWYRSVGSPGLASTPGIALTMGVFVLVTALLPGALLPKVVAGSDLDQLIQPRRILAHWVHAAILQGAEQGRRVSQTVTRELAESLLPRDDEPEPVVLMWAIVCFESGDFAAARSRLERALAQFAEDEDGPDWLATDFFSQAGAMYALVDGAAARAETCLTQVRRFEALPWYGDLLEACVAEARHDAARRDALFAQWSRAVSEHPRGVFALSGNQWVVAELERRGAVKG